MSAGAFHDVLLSLFMETARALVWALVATVAYFAVKRLGR